MVPFRKGADGVVARESRFAVRFETFACERPPRLRGIRWLRDFLLTAHPPLLTRRGMTWWVGSISSIHALRFICRWQRIGRTCPPHIECRQEENTQEKFADQAADNDNCEWPLRIGSNSVRHGRREQPQCCDEHRHHDRPEPAHGSFHRGSTDGHRSEEHTSELQSLAYLVCR